MPIIPGTAVVSEVGVVSSGTLAAISPTPDNTARAILSELVTYFGADSDQGDLKFDPPSGPSGYPVLRGLATLANRVGAVIAQPSRTPVTGAVDPYTVLVSDVLIAKTGIGGASDTITIPGTLRDGRRITIKDESGACAPGAKIILAPGAGNIQGAATYDMTVAYQAVTIYSDGTNWFFL